MPLHNMLFACSSKHPAGPARKLVNQDRSQAGLTNQGYDYFTKHSGTGARPGVGALKRAGWAVYAARHPQRHRFLLRRNAPASCRRHASGVTGRGGRRAGLVARPGGMWHPFIPDLEGRARPVPAWGRRNARAPRSLTHSISVVRRPPRGGRLGTDGLGGLCCTPPPRTPLLAALQWRPRRAAGTPPGAGPCWSHGPWLVACVAPRLGRAHGAGARPGVGAVERVGRAIYGATHPQRHRDLPRRNAPASCRRHAVGMTGGARRPMTGLSKPVPRG
jgi:hypothetical protein